MYNILDRRSVMGIGILQHTHHRSNRYLPPTLARIVTQDSMPTCEELMEEVQRDKIWTDTPGMVKKEPRVQAAKVLSMITDAKKKARAMASESTHSWDSNNSVEIKPGRLTPVIPQQHHVLNLQQTNLQSMPSRKFKTDTIWIQNRENIVKQKLNIKTQEMKKNLPSQSSAPGGSMEHYLTCFKSGTVGAASRNGCIAEIHHRQYIIPDTIEEMGSF